MNTNARGAKRSEIIDCHAHQAPMLSIFDRAPRRSREPPHQRHRHCSMPAALDDWRYDDKRSIPLFSSCERFSGNRQTRSRGFSIRWQTRAMTAAGAQPAGTEVSAAPGRGARSDAA
jgi:hypothetical protein